MPALDPAAIFVPRLNALGAPWAATGAIASIIYGEVRTTQNIDVIILFDARALAALITQFQKPSSIVRHATSSKLNEHGGNMVTLISSISESGYKADVYPSSTDPLHVWALRNRRPVEIAAGTLWLAPPEYVIIHKLEFFREGGSENICATFAGCWR